MFGFGVCVLLVECDLIRKFLYLFVSQAEVSRSLPLGALWRRRVVRFVVLRYIDLDPIMRPQDVLEVLARVENVDANASVEASWLEQPQVLPLVL